MPKSKRDKKVSLTKTTKKGLQVKQSLVEEIRKSVKEYDNIYVFTVDNVRNNKLKDLRQQWKASSRFFFGKNKVMCLGLGRKKEEELEANIHKLTPYVKGQCGLLFTNSSKDEVTEFFDKFVERDYIRAGSAADETVTLEQGPLTQFPHSMEPQLRQLGLPTALDKGVVTLLSDYVVCEQGKPVTSQNARLLKLLDIRMASFRVCLICTWSKKGEFEVLKHSEPDETPNVKTSSKRKKKRKISESVAMDET